MTQILDMLRGLVRKARLDAGLSQYALPHRGRIDRSYLSELERDIKSPTVKVLLKLCRALDVSAADVIREVERSRPRKSTK